MKKKLNHNAIVKRAVVLQSGIKTRHEADFYKVASVEAGELYEGVTSDAPISSSCDYRMVSNSDETVNTQGS